MLYTYFREFPGEILEAARMDGAGLRDEIVHVLTPMAIPGIVSTLLLNIILAWNESFWTIQLTTKNARPRSAFIASFSSPQGLDVEGLALESALWCRYCAGVTDQCAAIAPDDPDCDRLTATAQAARTDPSVRLGMTDICGATGQDARFAAPLARWLAMLWTSGTEATLRAYLGR